MKNGKSNIAMRWSVVERPSRPLTMPVEHYQCLVMFDSSFRNLVSM